MEDMNTMLENSSLPTSLCRWLQYLRTPGVTLQYTIEKHHIPDMNAAPAGGCATGKKTYSDSTSSPSGSEKSTEDTAAGKATGGSGAAGCAAKATDTADNMQVTGTLRARYFDLAAGMLGIVAVCCLVKGCLCGCKCIRKHMC